MSPEWLSALARYNRWMNDKLYVLSATLSSELTDGSSTCFRALRAASRCAGALLALAPGCAGNGDDGTATNSGRTRYDADYDCQQTIGCLDARGEVLPSNAVVQCTQDSNALYAQATAAQRAAVETAFGQCQQLLDCAYLDCVADQLGGRSTTMTDTVSVSGSDLGATAGPTVAVNCAGLDTVAGAIPTSQGNIPYDSAEARLWVNLDGCLTAVDLELLSGTCSLRIKTLGPDASGAFMIQELTLNSLGLCPDYPETVLGRYRIETNAVSGLGSVEIDRPADGFDDCQAGTITASIAATFPDDIVTPEVDDIVIETSFSLSGELGRTHVSVVSCP